MEKWETEYSIFLSYYKEKMFGTLLGRIDKTINFALILSGSAVFADFGSNKLFGALVAGLSALVYVGEFAKRSSEAFGVAKEYHELILTRDKHTDESLLQAFCALNKKDSPVWNCLSVAARNRTRLALYGKEKAGKLGLYTTFEAIMSWLAGDKP
ncbi:hypothetical protein [Kosakonia sp. MH5]|uniref:hypothetical protein n=1 Tax=Kosakonia sp. MH5 TaxID=2202822 RepID=UPI00137524BE|nr:hypothetical protein [Kosakonia sp. MH5]